MKQKTTVVRENLPGLYVWEMPDGRWVGDDEGHWMNIKSMRGDLKRIAQLKEAARAYGITEGKAVFLEGHNQVTDDEYEVQRQRLEAGLMPDPYDLGHLIDEMKQGKTNE
jgi:hypothetical protein